MHLSTFRFAVVCIIAVSSAPAHAYLDPGTGSALIQGLIAAVTALGITAKLYWHRVTKFFSRKEKSKQGSEDDRQEQR